MAKAAAEGAGEAEAEVEATGAGVGAAAGSSSDSESLLEDDDDEEEDELDELERLRFLRAELLSSGAGLCDAEMPPLASFMALRRARRLPNSPPPLPPPVTPFCGVWLPLPAVTKLLLLPTELAPEATPMALREPTTAALLPRFMPIPRLSSFATGMLAMRLLKAEPPFARMAAWLEALPSCGFESGFQPIEARRRKPGALVSVCVHARESVQGAAGAVRERGSEQGERETDPGPSGGCAGHPGCAAS